MQSQEKYKLIDRSVKYEQILCLNANIPEKIFFEKISEIPIIAADGAAEKLKNIDIIPEKIIGDLDSISSEFPEEKLIHVSDQDTNDFEKALLYFLENKIKNILIVGFHGGELEHTLNNWSVFQKYQKKLDMRIYDSGRIGIPLYENVRINCRKDETFSIIPQPIVKLSTKGLVWELNDEYLEMGVREGARNQTKSDKVYLTISEGSALVFMDWE